MNEPVLTNENTNVLASKAPLWPEEAFSFSFFLLTFLVFFVFFLVLDFKPGIAGGGFSHRALFAFLKPLGT